MRQGNLGHLMVMCGPSYKNTHQWEGNKCWSLYGNIHSNIREPEMSPYNAIYLIKRLATVDCPNVYTFRGMDLKLFTELTESAEKDMYY